MLPESDRNLFASRDQERSFRDSGAVGGMTKRMVKRSWTYTL